MKRFPIITIWVLLMFGCGTNGEEPQIPEKPEPSVPNSPVPSSVSVFDEIAGVYFAAVGSTYEYFRLDVGVNQACATSNYMQELSMELENTLCKEYPTGKSIHCIAQSTEEFHIYADQVLWGVMAGKPLEDYFVIDTNGYDFPITYPDGEIDFSKDFRKLNIAMDEILRKEYMFPSSMAIKFKDIPKEVYNKITFSFYIRTSNGKEHLFSATWDNSSKVL